MISSNKYISLLVIFCLCSLKNGFAHEEYGGRNGPATICITAEALTSFEIANICLEKSLKLKNLYLNCDEIYQLPQELGLLKNLERLELSSNNLFEIPEEIGDLKKLSMLSIDHNNLTSLPISILLCESLEIIDISGNPEEILQDPVVIALQNNPQIYVYFCH